MKRSLIAAILALCMAMTGCSLPDSNSSAENTSEETTAASASATEETAETSATEKTAEASETEASDESTASEAAMPAVINGTVTKANDYDIWVTLPDGWEKSDSDNLDYQCYNDEDGIYLSMFIYYEIDLARDMGKEELFEVQVDDLISKRDNTELIKENTLDDGSLYALYSGEKDGNKFYYAFWMLEFENTDQLVWVAATGIPSEIISNMPEISQIVAGITDTSPEI